MITNTETEKRELIFTKELVTWEYLTQKIQKRDLS